MLINRLLISTLILTFSNIALSRVSNVSYCGQLLKFDSKTATFKKDNTEITIPRLGQAPKGTLPAQKCVDVNMKSPLPKQRNLASMMKQNQKNIDRLKKKNPKKYNKLIKLLSQLKAPKE